ncbi:MAG: family transporter [Alphaproteobacteria bacterium]|jgi:predicted PurR-regulated permease PerM|nr:family transporter [Alphaproteobacteria bacterium]
MASIAPDLARKPTRKLDDAFQIALAALLIYACIRIVMPFIGVLLWSAILAVMLYPLHLRLARRLGNRWSALLIGLVGVTAMFLLTAMVLASLGASLYSLFTSLQDGTLTVKAPPGWLAELPLVGAKLADAWIAIAANVPEALAKYGPMLKGPAASLAAFASGLVAGEMIFVASFAIAAVLVAYGEGCAGFAERLLTRILGSAAQGSRLVILTAATIRGVATGVVGVAVIQAVLTGIGFFAIGLEGAGLLTLVILLFAIVQVPVFLITLPVIVYVFATEATTPAIIFTVWTVIAGLSDNVLKPLMLGRGLEVPMPVILIGVIGGMIVDGLVGLFIGPVVLAVAYVLLMEWMRQSPATTEPPIEDQALLGPGP